MNVKGQRITEQFGARSKGGGPSSDSHILPCSLASLTDLERVGVRVKGGSRSGTETGNERALQYGTIQAKKED